MPPNGPDEWRARIGQWENRKLRWYQAHLGSRPRVPMHFHLKLLISEVPLLCALLVFSLTEKVPSFLCEAGNGALFYLGKLVRCRSSHRGRSWTTPQLISLFLALSLLLVLAGDVETNPGPINDEFLDKVDDSELSEEDTRDVYHEVVVLAGSWSNMCLALGLFPCDLSAIEAAHPRDPHRCLQAVVIKWLQKGYNYQRFGRPSWRTLVKSVADPAGGNNCALGEAIAKNHPVTRRMTADCEETPSISDEEEWDPPIEFADMLTTVTELLDKSASVERIKKFLKFLCHPYTKKRYIDIKLYEHCITPGEIVEVLCPQYINFMHTHLLRQIVNRFGNEQPKLLLKEYEDRFPRKKPLKKMRDPLSDEEMEACTDTKRVKVVYSGASIENSTVEDVERVQKLISKNTGVNESVIPFANQRRCNSVIFTFLIPETVISVFNDLDKNSQKDLTNHGILRIEVNDRVIDLQSSQLKPKTDVSTYTTSGIKRVPLMSDFPCATHYNSEFQQLISEVGALLAESVETSVLKEYLLSISHILYPETQYIDPRLLEGVETVPQIFAALKPQHINFLNWGVLQKAVDTFDTKVMPVVQSYTTRFYPNKQLSTMSDPLSEEQISEFKELQKLRVTCGGGSDIELTLGDVQMVREALEKTSGIDQDFIIYTYWEGGFTTHQFTFLIPKSICGIFWELCEEDLNILAGKGVQRLEVDYDTVADNIHELYKPQAVAPFRIDNQMRTKCFGVEHFAPKDKIEPMSEDEINDLITSSPPGKLQETCSDAFLKNFTKKIGNWKDLAPYLGINEWDLADLATMFPGDEVKQKYMAFVNWKRIDLNSATYEKLLECLLTHGHVDDARELLLHFQGTEIQIRKAQGILRLKFLQDSFFKRKLWLGASNSIHFNRRFGIVQKVPFLSELDCTNFEMIDRLPSEIQELSMKCMLNKITQRESRVFVLKGPKKCGKTELVSRICSYWAEHHALRKFTLVLYINVLDVQRGCSVQELVEKQFNCNADFSEKICCWIQDNEGNGLLFILDGFCFGWLYDSPLQEGDILYDILFGIRNYSRSTVAVATTCSEFVKPLPTSCIQFEFLGLTEKQVGRGVIQHFDKKQAEYFLCYLGGSPEMKELVSSPIHLLGTMYVFTRISYDDLPLTMTQLYTSLVVLVNQWHKRQLHDENLAKDSMSQFTNCLLKNSRKVIEGSEDLLVAIGRSFTDNAREFEHELPYLQYFLFALKAVLNPSCEKIDETLSNVDAYEYFWLFFAGLEVETDSEQLSQQFHKMNVLTITKCVSESGYLTARQQASLSTLTAEVSRTVATTRDIHSVLHCLPYMKNPHTMVLNKCFLGTQAVKELSRFLATDSWSNVHTFRVIRKYSGVRHLCLAEISAETVSAIVVALKTNHSLKILNLQNTSDEAVFAVAVALKTNCSLQTLNLEENEIRDVGATALGDALRVNQSLKILNLKDNILTDTGAIALARTLQQNKSLVELKLVLNEIGSGGATALGDALRMNHSLKILNFRDSGLTSTVAIPLIRAIQHNKSLEELNLSGNILADKGTVALAKALQQNKSLKILNLANNGIEEDGVAALATALMVNQTLETLNLEQIKIGSKGATALVGALRVNRSLKSLHLTYSDLGLARKLKQSKPQFELSLLCDEYKWIRNEEEDDVLADLRVLKSLKTLDVRQGSLTTAGGVALARALQCNKSLEKLNLTVSRLTFNTFMLLASAFLHLKSLQELNLSSNIIGNTAATAIADVLRVSQSLKILNLKGNRIGSEGATALAGALRVNKSLEILNLRGNRIGSVGAAALAAALRVNQTLKILNLMCNRILGSDGVITLVDALSVNQSLEELSLGGLLDISETAKQLARGCNRVGVWFFGDESHSEPEENFQLLLS